MTLWLTWLDIGASHINKPENMTGGRLKVDFVKLNDWWRLAMNMTGGGGVW